MKKENIKVYIYSLLFLFVVIIDQRLHTGSIVVSRTFVQALALPFLGIMLLQMKRERLKRSCYKIYIIATVFIAIIGSIWFVHTEEFYLKYILFLLEFLIAGFIFLYAGFNKSEYIKKIAHMNWKAMFGFALLFLMCISKYDGLWTWAFLVIFISLSFLNIDYEEQGKIFQGMIYGIISSYFIIQGIAFVFRPYDMVRYYGLYNNPNMNALFYVVVFAAFLTNQFRLNQKKSRKIYMVLNYIFMISVIGFTILTMGKAAIIAEIVLVILYFIIIVKSEKAKIKFLCIQFVLWISTILILLPLCFFAARFLPPLFHHSVWFYGEYTEERVHSFDAYDSEKYPEVEEVTNMLLSRYLGIEKVNKNETIVVEKTMDVIKNIEDTNQVKAVVGDGLDAMHPLYINGEVSNSYTARIGIWKNYFIRLNFKGHPIGEGCFWLTESYYILHAHNVFLEFSYNFGIVVGILFLLGYVIVAINQFIITLRTNRFIDFAKLNMLLILGLFGMFELDWYIGQIPLTLFFFILCSMNWDENKKLSVIKKGEHKSENINS